MSSALIVDDSPADRALFRRILTRAGFEVHEVGRGREVPDRARELRPQVIILDVNLPDMDGHSVCRALRSDAEFFGVPVLMLTVRDHEADVLAGLEAGADDYVAKDALPEIFVARVRRLVRYRQLMRVAALNEGLIQVGRLVTGIVHEIRGPLSVIRGNAELMRLTLGDADDSQQWVDPIIRATRLLQARLEHLMAAVRTGPPTLEPLEVGPLVREAADLFQKGIDPRAGRLTIETEVAPDLPAVRGDAGRLLQVLLNLLGNAHDAIHAGRGEGRIVSRVGRGCDDRGEWIKIEVADDGPGVPEALIERIFEPFFTTKDSGSGYGLYLAEEILREHGGRLSACNLGGGGACFTIWLPLEEAKADIRDAPDVLLA